MSEVYTNKKIYIAGHTGMVGSAITNELKRRGYKNLILKNYPGLDLIRQKEVEDFFKSEKPVFLKIRLKNKPARTIEGVSPLMITPNTGRKKLRKRSICN